MLIPAGARIGDGVRIDPTARIEADEATIGDGTVIGPGVVLRAGSLLIGPVCELADRCRIEAAQVTLGCNVLMFPDVTVLADSVGLGSYAKLSRRAVLKAGRISAGAEFWMNHDAEIGGGGWRGGGFLAGSRCHVGTGTHVNTAADVVLGDDTAIGMHCVLASHAHWQPATLGHKRRRAPITLGSDVSVYSMAVLSPGVTVGDRAVITAGAVVTADVAERSVVGGVPARPIGTITEPNDLAGTISQILAEIYAAVGAESERADERAGRGAVSEWRAWPDGWIRQDPHDAHVVTVTGQPAAAVIGAGAARATFDLRARTVSGSASVASEQIRQAMFGHGLRFTYAGGYVRSPNTIAGLVAAGIEEL